MRLGGALRARWGRTGRSARWAAFAMAVALAAGAAAWGVAAGDAPRVRTSDQRIAVVDGPRVSLDTTFYRPVGGGRAPAVLLGHGFGGDKRDVAAQARDLARAGYAVLAWSARGFGQSTGEIALDSPDYEVKDTRQLIDWLARRPDVRLDAPGDPRLFPLDHADATARAIARNGAPVSVVWFQGGHDGGDPETHRIDDLVLGFFDARLKGSGEGPRDGFTVTRAGGLDSSTQRVVVDEATARTYPGLSNDRQALPLGGGPQTIYNPAGGSPTAISALPGLGAAGSLGGLAGGPAGGRLAAERPGQFAVFDTAPLPRPLQLTGAASVTLSVDGDGPLFAKLYDLAPGGGATLARRLAAPFRASVGDHVTVELPATDYRFGHGHRVRLVVATTDMGFATPAKPASYKVRVVSPLNVPAVPSLTAAPTPVPAGVWALPLVAVAVALGIVLPGRLRRGPEKASDVPLEIVALTKAYKNRHLAVADLSFRVEKGQVLGLLGPNGAGKTAIGLRHFFQFRAPRGGLDRCGRWSRGVSGPCEGSPPKSESGRPHARSATVTRGQVLRNGGRVSLTWGRPTLLWIEPYAGGGSVYGAGVGVGWEPQKRHLVRLLGR